MLRAEERLLSLWKGEPGLRGFFSTVDHKKIGKRYIITAFAFLIAGGILAALMRLQLATPNAKVLSPEAYNQVFTMHGTTMIFWYASPILSGFAVYVIPLMIGARDMAYPRLNAFTYWTFLLSGLFLFASMVIGQAPDDGWFAYVPYALKRYSPGLGMDFYALALLFLTVSTTGGAVNFVATILRHRAPGMTPGKSPLFLYSTLTVSATILFALPALSAACIALELDRQWGFHFFDLAGGGSPILWQHLFWFFGHPWVYVIFLPATGMISMLLPVFSRRPIVAHKWVAISTVMTAVIGFSVWVHHMFATGVNHGAMVYFSVASMVISVFTTIQVFAWIATMVKGRPVWTTSMIFAVGFIGMIVIGGLSGVVSALIPVDWQITDTYFVVAHIHYVLIGANVFPVFAALYYWFPKMTGRLLDERMGKWSFALMFIGFNMAFFPMHFQGLLGMTRRIYTYGADRPWATMNLVETIGAGILTVGIAITLINVFVSYRRGALAGKNPWGGDTLEWETESPPEVFGSAHLPTVATLHPVWDDHNEEYDPTDDRVFDQTRLTLTTTIRDAEPVAVAKMPEDTLLPLWLSLAFTGLFTALLLKSLAIAGGLALVSLIITAIWLWPEPDKKPVPPAVDDILPGAIDKKRGTFGMKLFIATEAMLFVCFFFAYFLLRHENSLWPQDKAPKLAMPFAMLAILIASSIVLHVGEKAVKVGRFLRARVALGITILLGIAFLIVQAFEYGHHLHELVPQDDAYASIFYTITSLHAAHLVLGLLMLGYTLFLPRLDPESPPHRPLENAALYWHFVDLVWVVIVAVLYVGPHL